jgi:hypothetical protein
MSESSQPTPASHFSILNYESLRESEISGLTNCEMDFLGQLVGNSRTTPVSQWNGLTEDQERLIGSAITNAGGQVTLRELTEDEVRQVKAAEDESKKRTTAHQTEIHVKKFKKFLLDQQLPTNIESNAGAMCDAVSSLTCFCGSMHRHLMEKIATWVVIDNPDFVAFDRTYKAAVAKALESKKSVGFSLFLTLPRNINMHRPQCKIRVLYS